MQRATSSSSRERVLTYARALDSYVARPAGSARTSASRIAATARSPLRGSCHQCGSSPIRRTRSISVTTCGSAPAPSITSPSQLVEVAAGADDQPGAGDRLRVAGPRLVVVRVGVGRQQAVDVDPVAAHVGDHVGDLGRRGDDRQAAGGGVVAPAAREHGEREERGEQGGAHRGRR